MAHCFQLTKIGETEPSTLNSVDEALAAHLGIPVHPKRYAEEWFNVEGLALASGMTLEVIKNQYVADDNERLPIIDWFLTNYTAYSFRA